MSYSVTVEEDGQAGREQQRRSAAGGHHARHHTVTQIHSTTKNPEAAHFFKSKNYSLVWRTLVLTTSKKLSHVAG